MKKISTLLIVIVVVGIVAGGLYYLSSKVTKKKSEETAQKVPFDPVKDDDAELKTRDAQRRGNVNALIIAVAKYQEKNKKCPAALTDIIDPAYTSATKLPTDPGTKENYAYKIEGAKCIVSATLEDAANESLKTDAIPDNGAIYDQSTE